MDSSVILDRVTLMVKASNQQFEDQTIICECTWSVKQLKEHLHEVYPCKPRVDEQKLIYAGQLLTDKLILKDILRTYEGVYPPNHTMHLVYTPKMRQQLNPTTAPKEKTNAAAINEGLRHRNINVVAINDGSSSSTQRIRAIENNPQMSAASIINCPNSHHTNNVPGYGFQSPSNEYLMAQQMAMQNWMQQAYVQYMNQYMNLLSIGVRPESVYMQNQPNISPVLNNNNLGVPQMPYLPQNFSFPNTNAPNLENNNNSIPQNPVIANAEGTDTNTPVVPVPAVEQQPQQPQNEQPQPRFPNIVQEELPENRDWLDMFYSFSRLLVLLTLVYFYSSPLRCLVVLFIGLAIYLYHIGFFRTAGETNNNNNNNNAAVVREENIQRQNPEQEVVANVAPQLDNNIPEQENQQQQQTAEENSIVEGGEDVNASSNPVPEAQNNGTSVIAFIRTFVVSFFVSLLPETPAL